ncbi:hypothetical protein GDO78_020455 [Eleutherodactylus coqui]|uniref:Uncharacterized protein n=1 Tax=Eleutherodactylus coqui TaxID=57060 RepID=A0A8J6E5H5_ELECQ|nr:hypothetical protein GDO78_020455 [Eleutherodactylus coqui]
MCCGSDASIDINGGHPRGFHSKMEHVVIFLPLAEHTIRICECERTIENACLSWITKSPIQMHMGEPSPRPNAHRRIIAAEFTARCLPRILQQCPSIDMPC